MAQPPLEVPLQSSLPEAAATLTLLGTMAQAFAGAWHNQPLHSTVACLSNAVMQKRVLTCMDASWRLIAAAAWEPVAANPTRPLVRPFALAAAPGGLLALIDAMHAQWGGDCELDFSLISPKRSSSLPVQRLYRLGHAMLHYQTAAATSDERTPRRDILDAKADVDHGALQLGQALAIGTRAGCWADEPFGPVLRRLSLAIHLRQSAIDEHGSSMATWAWLSTEAMARLTRGGLKALHATDWDEGEHLVVIDHAPPRNPATPAFTDLALSGKAMEAASSRGGIHAWDAASGSLQRLNLTLP